MNFEEFKRSGKDGIYDAKTDSFIVEGEPHQDSDCRDSSRAVTTPPTKNASGRTIMSDDKNLTDLEPVDAEPEDLTEPGADDE